MTYTIVLEKMSMTTHIVETDDARIAFNVVRKTMPGQKTWLVVKDVVYVPYGTGNCLDGYLTAECSRCAFWMNGKNGCGVGCGAPFPISHCDAFSAFEKADSAMRRYSWIEEYCNNCEKRFDCNEMRTGSYWSCEKFLG